MSANHVDRLAAEDAGGIIVQPLRVSGRMPHGRVDVPIVNYTYVVGNPANGEALIVDPAWELGTIEAELLRMNVRLSAILLTHAHFDHVNLVDPLVARHDAEVWISAPEAAFYAFRCSNLRQIPAPAALPSVSSFLAAGLRVVSYLTPGHTKGSVCFRIGSCLFSGDTLFCEGCGICVGPGADPGEMFLSLQLLKARCGPETRVFPGHSFGELPGKTFGQLRDENVYLNINDRDQFRSFRMRGDQGRLFDFK